MSEAKYAYKDKLLNNLFSNPTQVGKKLILFLKCPENPFRLLNL